MRKIPIGWTVLRDGKPTGQAETWYSRRSALVTPVYDTIGKARSKATRLGLTYDAIVEAFVELSDE